MRLVPDFIFRTFLDASVDFLMKNNVKGLILDIDNTLEPYEHPKPGPHVLSWFDSLKSAGIAFSVVSNNNKERVLEFLEGIDIPAYYKAKKPFKSKLVLAMRDMGTNTENTLFIGDQILTDVWAAHNAKIKAALVPPINDKRDPFTRFKRLLEKPFLRKYERIKGKKNEKA